MNHRLGEAERVQQLGGANLERGGINLVKSIVDSLQSLIFGSEVLHDVLLELLQARELVGQLVNHRLNRGAISGLCLLS